MPNPYATNKSSYRPTPTKQVALGQSNALKRLEKLQAKHTGSSVERRSTGSPGKMRKSHEYSLESDEDDRRNLDDDDEDDEDEDSLFKNAKKNANKFMKQKGSTVAENKKTKKKYEPQEDQLTDSQESDLEISVMDRSSTPLAVKQRQAQIRPSSKTSSRLGGAASAMSSLSSMKSKKSQSKVKFMKTNKHNEIITDQENEEEAGSTILEDLMNNLMTIDDLEPAAGSTNSFLKAKPSTASRTNTRNRFLKSPLKVDKSLEEENEAEYSSLTPSIDSPSMSETKLVDIEELEKSLEKIEQDQKKKKNKEEKKKKEDQRKKDEKKQKIASDSDKSKKKNKSKKKASKEKKSRTSTIVSIQDDDVTETDDTIATEIISESFNKSIDSDIKTLNESQSSRTSKTSRTSRTSRSSSRTGRSSDRTPRSGSRTPRSASRTERSTSRTDYSRNERSQFQTSSHKSQLKSYNEDFETEGDLTSRRADLTDKRKQLSFATDHILDTKPKTTHASLSIARAPSSSVETQVDTADLLKYSNLLKTVNVYNPSSLLLATVSHFDDNTATLRDLNQLTGYNMINQTFNDMFKYNLNFMKNFLAAQRSLYEQQIQSIQPTYHPN